MNEIHSSLVITKYTNLLLSESKIITILRNIRTTQKVITLYFYSMTRIFLYICTYNTVSKTK